MVSVDAAVSIDETPPRGWHRGGSPTSHGSCTSTFSAGQRVQSAPLLPASRSSHANSWFCTSFASNDKTSKRPSWTPLGLTWRKWDSDPASAGVFSRSSQLRSDVDNPKIFMQGCVPHWGKEAAVRIRGMLEHELTWAYYRTRRHGTHPLREEVGDPYLPQKDVCAQMRSGGSKFQFWRDLRPPFHVVEVQPIPEEGETQHPNGRLYAVQYLCGIEYAAERMWNEKSDGGTFNNKIQGIAKVRMKDEFPRSRAQSRQSMTIVSWGKPCLGLPTPTEEEQVVNTSMMIPPDRWMPIADELGKRPDSPRFAACREETRRALPKKGTQVPPVQKLLLGTHPELPALVSCEVKRIPGSSEDDERGVVPFGAKPKSRVHRVFTPAAGFVKYSG